jgi:hypothetical protein
MGTMLYSIVVCVGLDWDPDSAGVKREEDGVSSCRTDIMVFLVLY